MKPAALLLVFAACASAQLREIPEVLKSPGKLRDYQFVVPKGMKIEAPPPAVCSVRLLEYKPEVRSNMPVIRPKAESKTPVIEPPAPPCAKPE